MSALFPDTCPEAEQVQIELLRQAPAWRKLEMVGQLNQTVRTPFADPAVSTEKAPSIQAMASCPLSTLILRFGRSTDKRGAT